MGIILTEGIIKKKEGKNKILKEIEKIYHSLNGVPGYQMMTYELGKYGIKLSPNTVHSYIKYLGLMSITRRKSHYKKGKIHKIFPTY